MRTLIQNILSLLSAVVDWISAAFGIVILTGIWTIAAVGFAVLVWWWTGAGSDELVLYPARCANDTQILPRTSYKNFNSYVSTVKSCEISPLRRDFYVLNRSRAEVHYRTELIGAQKLVDCSIFDRSNWTCSYPDGSGKVIIIDGLQAIDESDANLVGGVWFYLRRWQWWTVQLHWLVGTPLPPALWLVPDQNRAIE